MLKIKTLSYMWFLILVTIGCTEPIDLRLKTTERTLVVDGIISNESHPQMVRLSWSAPYFSTSASPPVSGALVSISEGNNIYNLDEATEYPGSYYIMPEDFLPEPGKTYTLKIEILDLDNDGETEIYSAITTMPQFVDIDSIDLKHQYFNKNWEIWQVLAYFQDPPEIQNNYMFRISRNGDRVTNKPSQIRISDDRFFNGIYVNGLWVQSIDAREEHRQLNEGDVISLDMSSITKEFYDFMDAIKIDEQGTDPLFSGPPANMPGNISNGALGFFTAVTTSSADVKYKTARHK